MTNEEKLRVYAAYLPYELELKTDEGNKELVSVHIDDEVLGAMGSGGLDVQFYDLKSVKPILYDLSYLTKEIEHEGERFMSIRKIYEINGWEWNDDEVNEIDEIGICSDLDILTYATAQLLLSWHFNIFSLPESEYINKATL